MARVYYNTFFCLQPVDVKSAERSFACFWPEPARGLEGRRREGGTDAFRTAVFLCVCCMACRTLGLELRLVEVLGFFVAAPFAVGGRWVVCDHVGKTKHEKTLI